MCGKIFEPSYKANLQMQLSEYQHCRNEERKIKLLNMKICLLLSIKISVTQSIMSAATIFLL